MTRTKKQSTEAAVREIRSRRSQSIWAFALATLFVLHFLFLMPFTLYMGNHEDFLISLPNIMKHYALLGVPIVGVLGLLGSALPRSLFRAYSVGLAAICSLLWFQGNVLAWDYGLMDGSDLDWEATAWRGWLEAAVWSGVLALAIRFRRRLEKPVLYGAVLTAALPLSACIILGIQNAPDLSVKSLERPPAEALEEVYRFSSGQNVLQIIMDGFQTDVFEEILREGEEGRRLSASLEGFVLFKENIGAFPGTQMSIPAILSGKIYRNHVPRVAFFDDAIGGNTILNVAYDADYEVDLVVPASLFKMYERSKHSTAYPLPKSHHISARDYELDDAAKLLDLTVFRLAPHFLKEYVYNDQRWLLQTFSVDSSFEHLRFFGHNAFLRQLEENMSADRPAPVYKLLHLMLSHRPMVADENCEYAGQVLETDRATMTTQSRCSLANVVRVLEKMKKLGIYDDSLIVLMADHGAGVPPPGYRAQVMSGGRERLLRATTVGKATPVMAIKRPGATGPLEVSMAPTAVYDTPATVAAVLGLDAQFDGRSAFALPPGKRRQRMHHIYLWEKSDWTDEFLNPIQEYIINGSAYDGGAWKLGAQFHPNGRRGSR